MNVLRHSRLECPEHGPNSVARWASGKRTCWRCKRVPVEVEYVRADIHQGAVEALREHQRAFDEIDSAMHELDDAEALDAIVGIVNRTRGQ
jgi:hypothetical protein